MSGRHARETPSREWLPVVILGLLSLVPPLLIVGGALEAHSSPPSVSRTDINAEGVRTVHEGSYAYQGDQL